MKLRRSLINVRYTILIAGISDLIIKVHCEEKNIFDFYADLKTGTRLGSNVRSAFKV